MSQGHLFWVTEKEFAGDPRIRRVDMSRASDLAFVLTQVRLFGDGHLWQHQSCKNGFYRVLKYQKARRNKTFPRGSE